MTRLRIERVECFIVDLPTIRPHVLAMATMKQQSMAIVLLHCSDGVIGRGEGTTIAGLSYGGESPEGIKLAIDTYFAPVLTTCDPAQPALTMQTLNRWVADNRFAKCAVETALLDAQAQRLGAPLSDLLGGRVRERLPVLWTLASGDTHTDIAEAEQMLDRRRHNAFKLKIGKRPLADDVGHVAAIKRALGERASVRVDVNQAWDECTAKRGLEMLADAGVDLVEQPIAKENRDGMARLTALARLPVMADEALQGPESAWQFASSAAADVFAVKIAQSGGLSAAKRVGAIADAAGVALYGGTMLEGPLGTVASAHLFSTFPRLSFGTELFGPLLLTEELLADPLDYSEFSLAVPSRPGLGLTLDPEKVAAFRRDRTRGASVLISQGG